MKKYILLLFSSITLSNISFSQCASAGNDSVVEICRNQVINFDSLLSDNADTNGVWYNYFGNPITNSAFSSNLYGQYSYPYVVYDSICFTSDTSWVTINVITCIEGSIAEQSESFFKLSPNPVNDALKLTIPDGEVLVSVKIYNAMGQEVFAKKTNILLIDVALLENGFYTIELTINDKRYAKRFVKL